MSEYEYIVTLELPSGPVTVWADTPDAFVTDRSITQAEFDRIRSSLLARRH